MNTRPKLNKNMRNMPYLTKNSKIKIFYTCQAIELNKKNKLIKRINKMIQNNYFEKKITIFYKSMGML
jgi:hypothetical protein